MKKKIIYNLINLNCFKFEVVKLFFVLEIKIQYLEDIFWYDIYKVILFNFIVYVF